VGRLRPFEADEIGRLIDAIREADLTLPIQWPPRFRAEQEILSTGSAYDLARLIGVPAKRDVEKGLAATEREVLENAKTMLASELAVPQDVPLEEAEKQLDEVIAYHGPCARPGRRPTRGALPSPPAPSSGTC